TTYGNGEFLQWLADRNITPYMRTRDSIHRKNSPFYGPERFTYEPENQSLYLSRGPAAELRRPKSSQSRLDLHRDTQTVWPVRAPSAMHECSFPMPGHPSTRTGAATRTGASEHAGVCPGTAAKEESRSPVRRTQESDRTAPSTPATTKVRARAVLPGSDSAEHQATGPLPKPTDSTTDSHHLEKKRNNSVALSQPAR